MPTDSALLLRFTQALITQMAQTAVCNRHHSLDQQLCRWLLLSLDRLEGELEKRRCECYAVVKPECDRFFPRGRQRSGDASTDLRITQPCALVTSGFSLTITSVQRFTPTPCTSRQSRDLRTKSGVPNV